MNFFEFLFVFVSYFHDAAHIHFIKSGEHGRCILCFHQSAAEIVLRRLLIFSVRSSRLNNVSPQMFFYRGLIRQPIHPPLKFFPANAGCRNVFGSTFLSAIMAEATGVAFIFIF